jgi:hypothetical protein
MTDFEKLKQCLTEIGVKFEILYMKDEKTIEIESEVALDSALFVFTEDGKYKELDIW